MPVCPYISVNLLILLFQSVHGVIESMKVVTQSNSERVARWAFEYARRHGRKKVTTIHKANIMCVGIVIFNHHYAYYEVH